MGYRHRSARRTTTNATMFARMLIQRKIRTDNAMHVWIRYAICAISPASSPTLVQPRSVRGTTSSGWPNRCSAINIHKNSIPKSSRILQLPRVQAAHHFDEFRLRRIDPAESVRLEAHHWRGQCDALQPYGRITQTSRPDEINPVNPPPVLCSK
jgi:hypothetical protein